MSEIDTTTTCERNGHEWEFDIDEHTYRPSGQIVREECDRCAECGVMRCETREE